ncbi:MAG: hypothetical protein NW226_01045 [Microscillaceae bacterium]|nr:hypothetical protein [Microscillaceae bacterium]
MIFYLFFFVVHRSPAQNAIAFQRTFQSLREEILRGQKMALRDLGSLLDENQIIEIQLSGQKLNNRVGSIALKMLRDFTLFENQEMPLLENTTSLEFLNFYYQNEGRIFFSEFTRTFQIQAFPSEFSEYRLYRNQTLPTNNPEAQLKDFIRQMRDDLELNYYDAIPALIIQIGVLRTESSQRFLLECLQGKHWGKGQNPKETEIYRNLLLALRQYPSSQTLQALIDTFKEEKILVRIPPDLLAFSLSILSNVHPAYPGPPPEDYLGFYQNYLRQFPNLELLKKEGYQKVFDYTESNFQDSVDYYGTMLNQAYGLFWIKKHAFDDLASIRNPKVLLYLAAQLFQNRYETQAIWYADLPVFQKIRELTQVSLEVKNAQGLWVKNPETDDTSRLNYLRYWMIHYTDYSWDQRLQLFVNQRDSILPAPDYGTLIKKLYVPSEKESLRAFDQLAQIEHQEWPIPEHSDNIARLGENNWLPAFPFFTLKILNRWINFCRLNQLNYQMDSELENFIEMLQRKIPDPERYRLENEIVEKLHLDQLHALEYQAILHQNQSWYFGASCSRIIRKVYDRHWKELLQNPQHIRSYLKKTFLFESLKIRGACTSYAQKLDDLSKTQKTYFQEIYSREMDPDIRQVFARILKEPLLSPHFDDQILKDFTVQHAQDYKTICARIRQLQDIEKIKELFAYLAKNLSAEAVPALMDLLDDSQMIESKTIGQRTLNYTVADYAVFLLEKIYKHSFADEKDFYHYKPQDVFVFRGTTQLWKNLWANQKSSYLSWEKTFFEQKLTKLHTTDALKINLINNITSSEFYQKDLHFPKVQAVIKHIQPLNDLQYLYLPHSLNWLEIRDLLKGIHHPESLIHVLGFLEDTSANAQEILQIIHRQAQNLNNDQKGKFYGALFQKTNFRYWFAVSPNQINAAEILQSLQTYAQDLDVYDQEYYSIKKMQFFLLNSTKTITEQMDGVRQLEDPDDQSEALEYILLQAGYAGLGEILRNLNSFEQSPYPGIFRGYLRRYVQEDLGIPEDIGNTEGINRLLQWYRRDDQKDFYLRYALEYIPNLLLLDSSLNYTKIEEVLRFDLTEDFAGIVTGVRYWPVLTVIRLLELQHQTRLGFPENFLHSQAFYQKANIEKRITAWKEFLKKNLDH